MNVNFPHSMYTYVRLKFLPRTKFNKAPSILIINSTHQKEKKKVNKLQDSKNV